MGNFGSPIRQPLVILLFTFAMLLLLGGCSSNGLGKGEESGEPEGVMCPKNYKKTPCYRGKDGKLYQGRPRGQSWLADPDDLTKRGWVGVRNVEGRQTGGSAYLSTVVPSPTGAFN